jgi:hypothetical protein
VNAVDYDRLARTVAAYVIDALNRASFGEQLGETVATKVSQQIDLELQPDMMGGWWREYVRPAWSGWCYTGDHERCDGTALPSESGCHCTFCNHEGVTSPDTPADHPIGEPRGDGGADIYDREPGPGSEQ